MEHKNKMKGNIMKKLLALICSTMFVVAYAQAQTSTTSSTTTSQPATTSNTSNTTTASTTSSGTVTDYTPGAAITLDADTGKPVHSDSSPSKLQSNPRSACTHVKSLNPLNR